MKRVFRLLPFSVSLVLSAAAAAPWYVDDSVGSSGNGTSWATAFKTIQAGIDAASDGDQVVVEQGSYTENIAFGGKNITLQSTDPADWSVVKATIIDGNQAGAAVTFAGTEDETCVLSGFTIRNGEADTGAGICGGTADKHTLATIENNFIADNAARFGGGGLAYCDGTLRRNVISGNSGLEVASTVAMAGSRITRLLTMLEEGSVRREGLSRAGARSATASSGETMEVSRCRAAPPPPIPASRTGPEVAKEMCHTIPASWMSPMGITIWEAGLPAWTPAILNLTIRWSPSRTEIGSIWALTETLPGRPALLPTLTGM
jgi:hypothetical protein